MAKKYNYNHLFSIGVEESWIESLDKKIIPQGLKKKLLDKGLEFDNENVRINKKSSSWSVDNYIFRYKSRLSVNERVINTSALTDNRWVQEVDEEELPEKRQKLVSYLMERFKLKPNMAKKESNKYFNKHFKRLKWFKYIEDDEELPETRKAMKEYLSERFGFNNKEARTEAILYSVDIQKLAKI
ncbi:hypothetical protein GF312_13435 [Candidatus Poribacteria bacterium]|nr:hypothetical protein [Candidatus Poribacteria bacterium]